MPVASPFPIRIRSKFRKLDNTAYHRRNGTSAVAMVFRSEAYAVSRVLVFGFRVSSGSLVEVASSVASELP